MGFFSSRRDDHPDSAIQVHDESGIVRAFRSRFYGSKGKGKGKERDLDGDIAAYPTSRSTSSPHIPSKEKQSFTTTRGAPPRRPSESRDPHWVATSTSASLARHAEALSDTNASRRSSADVITITLAQRLNELATANSEGLLSDEEYRLLRQNLFERFASNTAVPAETPLVPMPNTGRTVPDSRTSFASTHDRRSSSQYHHPSSRTPSLQSKRSFTTTVTSLLRRATSRRNISVSMSGDVGGDAVSVFSNGSAVTHSHSGKVSHALSSQMSDSSLGHSRSRTQNFRPLGDAATAVASSKSSHRSLSRGRKRSSLSAPPSSYPGSPRPYDSQEGLGRSIDGLPDDDELESAKDIRTQIELVEAEGRHLLDAFNGLELSTLTRQHRPVRAKAPMPIKIPPIPSDGSIASSHDRRTSLLSRDPDTLSCRSGGSIRTARSAGKSPSRPRGPVMTAPSSATLVSQPPKPVSRKGSMSSMSSRGRSGMSSLQIHYGMGSSSSINLAKSSSHLPLATVAETDMPPLAARTNTLRTHESRSARTTESSLPPTPRSARRKVSVVSAEDEDLRAIEAELADIRRRKAEVTARYGARLEYLRAKLKGAELREKLLRK